MTTTAPQQTFGGLDRLLRDALRSLDITEQEYLSVISRYTELGIELGRHWGSGPAHNSISPQGSFLLGTVTRNIHRGDDIDIDCVALRDIDKASITQADLKTEVGTLVGLYAETLQSGHPRLSESSRCWTLSWPGMHMDVLPAVPNRDEGGTHILITDHDVQRWLFSNPRGYADWFLGRMRGEFMAERDILARELEVVEVPAWQVKTTLQRVVQALKRHRDVYFAGRLQDRPASIIITTLAAWAYQGGGGLYDVLCATANTMGGHLLHVDGRWVLPNPAQEGENFCDAWATEPRRAVHFFEWLEAARSTFEDFGRAGGLDHTVQRFADAFGDRAASATAQCLAESVRTPRQQGKLGIISGGTLVTSSFGRTVKDHGFGGG